MHYFITLQPVGKMGDLYQQFDFTLKGDLSDDLILASLDKTVDFIKNQKLNSDFKHPYFVDFDKKSGKR